MPVKAKSKNKKQKGKGKAKGKSGGSNAPKSKSNNNNSSSQSSSPNSKQNGKNNDNLLRKSGVSYNKEIQEQLAVLRNLLYDAEQILKHRKNNMNSSVYTQNLYSTAVAIERAKERLIELQGGPDVLWGFEDTSNTSPEARQRLISKFSQWFVTNAPKSLCGSLYDFSSECEHGNGVIALTDIAANTLCMNIPRHVMFSISNLEKSDITIRRFLKKDPMAQQIPSLAMLVLVWYERQKGSKSFWKPYLDVLPRKHNLPHECNIEDLIKFLRNAPILDKIIGMKIHHLKNYTYCRQAMARAQVDPGMRLVDYLWAAGTVMTRQNAIPTKNDFDKSEIVLIPGWDMCNYEKGKITSFFNTRSQSHEMHCLRDVAQGKEIYIYYGSQRNEQLFLNSGFVFEDNENDEMELDLKLDPNDSLYKTKQLQMKNSNLNAQVRFVLPVTESVALVSFEKYDDTTKAKLTALAEKYQLVGKGNDPTQGKQNVIATAKDISASLTENAAHANETSNSDDTTKDADAAAADAKDLNAPDASDAAAETAAATEAEDAQDAANAADAAEQKEEANGSKGGNGAESEAEAKMNELLESLNKKHRFEELSTNWMWQLVSDLGASIPRPAIQFGRIAQMTKPELVASMKQFVQRSKLKESKEDASATTANGADGKDGKASDEKVDVNGQQSQQSQTHMIATQSVGLGGEIVSRQNERLTWQMILNHIRGKRAFYQDKILLCAEQYYPELLKSDGDATGPGGFVEFANKMKNELKGKEEMIHVALAFDLVACKYKQFHRLEKSLIAAIEVIDEKMKAKYPEDSLPSPK